MKRLFWKLFTKKPYVDIGEYLIGYQKENQFITGFSYRAKIKHWLESNEPKLRVRYRVSARTNTPEVFTAINFDNKFKLVWFILTNGFNKKQFKYTSVVKVDIDKF